MCKLKEAGFTAKNIAMCGFKPVTMRMAGNIQNCFQNQKFVMKYDNIKYDEIVF